MYKTHTNIGTFVGFLMCIGLFIFSSFSDKQTNRQKHKQTDSNMLPTPTDSVGVGNNVVVFKLIHHRTAVRHLDLVIQNDNKAKLSLYISEVRTFSKRAVATVSYISLVVRDNCRRTSLSSCTAAHLLVRR